MSPAVIWLVAELTKLALTHLSDTGKYNTLTQEEAEKTVLAVGASLSISLPSPEELEKG